ncbi:MAG: TRAP transporter small permease [Shimia sp.]
MTAARAPLEARLRAGMAAGLRVVLGALLAGLVGLEVTMVALRYLFAEGIVWGRDVTILAMATMAWLGAALLWLERTHLAVDLLPARLIGGRAWRGATELVGLAAFLALIWNVARAMESAAFIVLPTLGTSAAVKFWPLAAGAVALVAAVGLNLWSLAREGRGG